MQYRKNNLNHNSQQNSNQTSIGGRVFEWGKRTYVMGIINLSPDSFSGDGIGDVESALKIAEQFVNQGADILDIGGESTRPGFLPVTAIEELARVIPVITRIAKEFDIPVSVDTYKPEVAKQALAAGAHIVNDIWGLKYSDELAKIAAQNGALLIIMANQRDNPVKDIIKAVTADLASGISKALAAGIKRSDIIVDPGIGFGKTTRQNLEVIRRLNEVKSLGHPILLGTSRKSFIGEVLNLPEEERTEGTAATVAIGIFNGADIVRVHDVEAMVRVSRMTNAIARRE